MKALTVTAYGDVENLTLAEVPEPNTGPGDVKIQVHAASINPLDWKLLSGYGRGTSTSSAARWANRQVRRGVDCE